MYTKNICRFVPNVMDANALHIIKFVLETKCSEEKLQMSTLYSICYVVEGDGILHTQENDIRICEGDIFFRFPSRSYSISSDGDLKYMYISFIGARGSDMLERIGINNRNFLFEDFSYLKEFWMKALTEGSEIWELSAESVLLHTLTRIAVSLGNGINKDEKKSGKDAVFEITQYIDSNYDDCTLNLQTLSKKILYNEKYISMIFKKRTGIGVSEYINTVRIQHACFLLEQNISCIKDVAYLSGFSDPLYFSKVFKKKIGMSPSEFKKRIKE